MQLGEDVSFRLRTGFKSTAHARRPLRPRYCLTVTDSGEPDRASHISKMVLSIVKFGGPPDTAQGRSRSANLTTAGRRATDELGCRIEL